MAQYNIPDPEDFIKCPYDDTHMIRAKRMPYHLMKCRKSFPVAAMVKCPFNARHEIPKVELRWHMSTCSDKAMIEKDMALMSEKQSGNYFQGDCSNPDYDPHFKIESSEDWDDEAENSTGSPLDSYRQQGSMQYCHNLSGMAPAQKRYFYEEQRQEYLMEQTRLERERKAREQQRQGDPPLRLPKAAPRVLQPVTNGYHTPQPPPAPAPQAQVNKLALAGIGRGQPKKQFQEIANGLGNKEQVLKSLAMGRGVGRGMMASTNGEPFMPVGRGRRVRTPRNTETPAPGLSNGIGRGNPQFIVPNVNQQSDLSAEEERNKEIRKLEKKLRGTEALETKGNAGTELNLEEMEKISKKSELLDQMKALKFD